MYIEKQIVIANQKEKLATSDLEHKKRELAMLSTNIVQENEIMSTILKDLRYYVSLLKTPKDQKNPGFRGLGSTLQGSPVGLYTLVLDLNSNLLSR